MTRPPLLAFFTAFVLAGCGGTPSAPSPGPASGGRLTMTFSPQDASFAAATEEYRRIWVDEGVRIEDAMEGLTGLSFPQSSIQVVVFEGVSMAGSPTTPMLLRASNDPNRKKATLVHELGHRLVNPLLTVRPSDIDDHRLLDLFLYDVWETLWGRPFADEAVQVESGQRGLYDYESAWQWALALSTEQRAARLAEIKKANNR